MDETSIPAMPSVEEQMRVIERGTVDLVGRDELVAKLRSGHRLRVKLGIDPSSPDIHLGHTVPLRKLRDFQRLGHRVIVLWGTSTAMLGDPTGKNKTRPQLTRDEVERNMATYKAQVGRVLDIDAIEERENGEWFDGMSFMDCVSLAARSTVARMLERDSFSVRYKAGEPISIHELLYPLMQGWDSVELRADVEIGGTDQLFNLLAGRELQRQAGQPPQVCITTPIAEGLDGVNKMSKSLGNYIGVTDRPDDMFGKVMSIPDPLMRTWFTLFTDVPEEAAEELLRGHPRDAKVALAKAIVAGYHDAAAADRAFAGFEAVFKGGALPGEVPDVSVPAAKLVDGELMVAAALAEAGICRSNSEGRRLIQGGGVKVDGVSVTDVKATLGAGTHLLQSGKRKVARVTIP